MMQVSRAVLVVVLVLALTPLIAGAQETEAPCISLDEAVATALANNPLIAVARERVARTEAQVREAAARGLPQVAAEANVSRTRPVEAQFGEGTVEIVPGTAGAVTGRVTQAIDVFGRVRTGVDLTEEQERIQRLELSRTERTVIFDTKNAYFNVLRAVSLRDVAQAGVDLAQDRLRLAQAAFEAGTVARFDVASAEVELANRRQALISAAAGIDTSRAALGNVMGIPVTQQFSIQPVTPEVTAPAVSLEQAVETAYSARPEVRAAESAVELQRLAVNLAEKQRLPLLGAFGQLERNLNPGALGTAETWRIGVNATWSIWEGGAIGARVRQAEADFRAAEDTLQQARLGVGLDVKAALVAVNEAYERVSVAEQGVSLAEEALRLAQVRYQAGISTAVEVRQAELDLIQARTNRVNTVFEYEVAVARLQRAMGQEPEAGVQVSEARGSDLSPGTKPPDVSP